MIVNLRLRGTLAVLLLMLLVYSCKDDKENRPIAMIYDGASLNIELGFQMYGGYVDLMEPCHGSYLIFLTEGAELQRPEGFLHGQGSLFIVPLFGPKREIVEGEYTYDAQDERSVYTFGMGEYVMDADFDLGRIYGDFGDVRNGTIKVSGSGDNYTIDLKCYGSEGKEISIYYQGPLPSYQFRLEDRMQHIKQNLH